jgi:anti-anti-sigma regulatory factor
VPGIEFTALRMLVEAEEKWRAEGVEIWLAALNPEVLELVRKTPLAERLGRERMFFTVEDAVAAYEARRPAAQGEPA